MNQAFTQRVYPGSKPNHQVMVLIIVGVILCLTILGIFFGVACFIIAIVLHQLLIERTCADCEKPNMVFKNYIAFSCYNCQAVNALKHNRWQLVENDKINEAQVKSKKDQSSYDELERLADLKDKGIITTEEFNAKKKMLLEI